jgi:hypothetical protein
MVGNENDKSARPAPGPKDAQKGGQGAIGKGDNEAELDQTGNVPRMLKDKEAS